MTANSRDQILHDFYRMMRVYKNGRVERLVGTEYAPPSVDPTTGVQSKDVEIAPEINVSARLYLPKTPIPARNFLFLSTFTAAALLLAPEHPLPIAYEDSWLALKWAASHSIGNDDEEWIKDYADLDHGYLGGDSAGANIAHNVAMRVGSEKVEWINLNGVFLNCPFFGGKDPMGNESLTTYAFQKNFLDKLWPFACPTTTGLDDPLINPDMDPNLSCFGSKKVLVYVAEKDVVRERGFYYKEVLEKSGWNGDVEVVEVKKEKHIFSVFYPKSDNGIAMLKRVGSFLNQHKANDMFDSKNFGLASFE
ncbi:putative carboxylesterase 2 [Forsythia ovata]|uniref:Carboxylesterase 2 n=1 Tax=Forsythia ovata TaxID=205694 RepID=A0ABD1VJJ4_9LAMI